jgi:hypothetical protein
LDGDKRKGVVFADEEDKSIRKNRPLDRGQGKTCVRLQAEAEQQQYKNYGLKNLGIHRTLDSGIKEFGN